MMGAGHEVRESSPTTSFFDARIRAIGKVYLRRLNVCLWDARLLKFAEGEQCHKGRLAPGRLSVVMAIRPDQGVNVLC
jgi:hypothetical protein